MAQLLTIRLSRNDTSCPWGFRLQGGKDFGTPLLIQKVNGNSLAEKAGLQVGDAVVRVNNHELFDQRHKDAQDAIVRAGNSFEMTVQRGGNNTWKPAVVPIGSTPSPNPYISSAPSPVTKTSLKASSKPSSPAIGTGYNSTAKTFNNQVNGNCVNGNGSVKAIVNKQYNSPVGIYSDESIAETLSAQAEVLAGGVLGVNFKKNEKDYNAETSEVFKMVKEAEKEPKEPEPEQNDAGGVVIPPPVTGLRHVTAPQNKPPTTPQSTLAPGQNICADCERLIVGVFVKIKDKNLHVECFKCATCGTSLKNVGYYNINNKLYCDIHAKMIARQNPPSPNLYPATDAQRPFSPAKMAPSCNLSNNQASRSPQSPAPTIAPIPFHAPRPSPTHVTPPVFSNQCVNNSYGKPSPPSQQAPTNQGCTFSSLNAGQYATIKTKHYDKGAGGGGSKTASSVGYSAPRRGRGVLNPQNLTPGARIPLCAQCSSQIRGPFVTALGKIWCPEHFLCVNSKCNRSLMDIGFVEEPSGLYCEYCFEQFLAPGCAKCAKKIKGDCLNAIGKHFHPECFTCAYCGKFFGNSPFFLEESLPYCENDWNELFTTKCFACGFPIEAGDRWVEALNNNYHSPCFNCTMCKTNLEGQSFYAKGGRPFCKNHAR